VLPLYIPIPLVSKDRLDLRFLLKTADENNGKPEVENLNIYYYAGYNDFKHKTTTAS